MHLKYNNCTTLYDKDCDGDNYRICIEGSLIKESSKGSCTYSVPGDIKNILVSLWLLIRISEFSLLPTAIREAMLLLVEHKGRVKK